MKQAISGHIAFEIHMKLKSHPLRGNRTQAEFYEFIFEKFLASPESKLAFAELELERAKQEKESWKARTKELEGQVSELKAVPVAAAPAESALPALVPPSDEPEGDFAATIRSVASDDSPSRTAVDLTLAAPDGRTFADRMVDFPPTPRAMCFKKAVGFAAADSIAKSGSSLTGKSVLVRRVKNPESFGPRFLTYYYPLQPSAIH